MSVGQKLKIANARLEEGAAYVQLMRAEHAVKMATENAEKAALRAELTSATAERDQLATECSRLKGDLAFQKTLTAEAEEREMKLAKDCNMLERACYLGESPLRVELEQAKALLAKIAQQKRISEMTAHDFEEADFEAGYDMCVETARLAK